MGSKMPVIYVQNADSPVGNSVTSTSSTTGDTTGSSCRDRWYGIGARQQ